MPRIGRKTQDRPFISSCLTFSHHRDDVFIVGGQDAIQVWKFDEENKKLSNTMISLGKIRRQINFLLVRADSDYVFCATDSGDIVKVFIDAFVRQKTSATPNLSTLVVACAVKRAPKKSGMNAGKFVGGVHAMLELKPNELLIGSGDGSVALVLDKSGQGSGQSRKKSDGITRQLNEPTLSCLQEMKTKQFSSAVTSLAQLDARNVLVGVDNGDVYQIDVLTFDATLLSSCHTGKINALAFPRNLEAVMATCGEDGLRVWELRTGRQVMNVTDPTTANCECLLFSPDGKSIISGWSDGCLRAHTPESGRLIFLTQGAHTSGVSALAFVSSQRGSLISGGKDGQMRTWILSNSLLGQGKPTLAVTVREHKAQVVNIEVTRDEAECISASKDGACIIWDIKNLSKITRKKILNCTAALVWSVYHPSESQILTLAMDSQLSYWEVFNADEIRQLVLGRHSSVTALSVDKAGEHFITATHDSLVKIWKYKQGSLCAIGRAKAGPITRVQYSPNGNYVVAITEEGAILVWFNYDSGN